MRRLEAAGGTCDFAVDIAFPFPLEVILEILGLPEKDFPLMLRLTQEWLGNEDPDLRRASSTSEDVGQALRDIMKYFTKLTAERQANPTDDLASLIANGVIDGEPLSTMDRLSYYLIIATAGHDTTSYAIACPGTTRPSVVESQTASASVIRYPIVRNTPGRICTALPIRSVPSVFAVNASSGTVARNATMDRSARSRSYSYSEGFGINATGMVRSDLAMMIRRNSP